MNGLALRVVFMASVLAGTVWTLILSLFVDWTTAWTVGSGSMIYGFVLLLLMYQMGEVAAARKERRDAESTDSDGLSAPGRPSSGREPQGNDRERGFQ